MKYEPLTADQTAALNSFAAHAGRTWKSKIIAAWTTSKSIPGHIHALRNSHGIAWLRRYKLQDN